MNLLKLIGIDTDVVCGNLAEKVRPKNLPEFIIFSDKNNNEVIDVCTINYNQTGTMSPQSYLVDSCKLAISLDNVANYTSITRFGETYSPVALKHYDCDKISKREINQILERTKRFNHLKLERID